MWLLKRKINGLTGSRNLEKRHGPLITHLLNVIDHRNISCAKIYQSLMNFETLSLTINAEKLSHSLKFK